MKPGSSAFSFAEKMRPFLLFFAIVLSLTSCMPMAWLPKISSIPNTEDKFTKATERILVLAVWEKLSGAPHGRKDNYLVFDPPLLLTVRDLPNLKKEISGKINVGLISVNGGIGHFFSFSGIIIISETGKVVRIFCEESRCNAGYDKNLIENRTDDLKSSVKKTNKEVKFPFNSIAWLYDEFDIKYQLLWDEDDKQLIIDFLDKIEH